MLGAEAPVGVADEPARLIRLKRKRTAASDDVIGECRVQSRTSCNTFNTCILSFSDSNNAMQSWKPWRRPMG